ncbi:Na(+)/H(+) antiporter subunit D [Halorientalis brevis]|uniref:Na(+)/H(+) antiporter subunit D n=1 Tax=Halorientalis brevis TaxID=1126241 RepID=A0ABD6CGI4_9EURY
MASGLTTLPPVAVFLAAALLVAVVPRRPGAIAGATVAALVVPWLLLVPAGSHLQTRLFGFAVVLFNVDPYSRTVGLILAFVTAVAVTYGYGTGGSRRQVALSLAYLGAGLAAVFAGDWLTLVLAWEGLAVSATALVWASGDDDAARAGLRYAVYHHLGGIALIAAVLIRYTVTGTFLFGGGFGVGIAAALGVLGIGLNVGFIGLHPWLVDTYPRPHVATSVALSVCTTKVGVYALARAVPDGGRLLAYVGGAMLLVGVTYAILQTDMRRLLSYHIVSQVGFMVAGIGIGSPLGIAGAFAHLVNNVLYKSLLFMIAGVLLLRTGDENLKHLGGLIREVPLTFTAFLIAAPAIAGVPGFNGFVSKAMVIDAAEDAGFDALWWLLVVGSVGTVVSFVKFGYYAFFHGDADPTVRDAGPAETLAFAAVAGPCLLFGLAPSLQFGVLPGATAAAKPFAPSQFTKAGAILGAGGVAFLFLKAPLARISDVPDLDAVYHPAGARTLRIVTGTLATAGHYLDAGTETASTAATRVLTRSNSRREPDSLSTDAVGRGVLLLVTALVVFLFILFA